MKNNAHIGPLIKLLNKEFELLHSEKARSIGLTPAQLFVLHYIFLGGWTGAAIGAVELVYLILMYVLEATGKTKYNIWLSLATMIATVTLSILTWANWFSLLPMIGMIEYLITMMFKNVIIVKSGTFVRIALNAAYMFLLKSYFGAALSVAILVFAIVGIVRDGKSKEKETKKEVELSEVAEQ